MRDHRRPCEAGPSACAAAPDPTEIEGRQGRTTGKSLLFEAGDVEVLVFGTDPPATGPVVVERAD